MNTNSILIAAAIMLATVQNQDHFDTGHKARYQPQPKKKRIISNNPKGLTQPKAFNRVQYKIPQPLNPKQENNILIIYIYL